MIGIDPESDGLTRARRFGVPTSAEGIEGLLAMPHFDDIRLVFDATSAGAHIEHWNLLRDKDVRVIDLTPAAIGPFCVPVVNLERTHRSAEPQHGHLRGAGHGPDRRRGQRGCAGALRGDRVVDLLAIGGPGTRANIDEFMETTARCVEKSLVALSAARRSC